MNNGFNINYRKFIRWHLAFALVLLTLLPPPLVTSTIDHTTELLRLHPISQTASQLTTWLPQPKIAHAAPSLVLSVNVNPANAEPGDRVVFTIRYRCASLTEHCLNTVIDHTLPTGMEIVKFSPSGGLIDTASFFGQTVTWTLQSLGSPAGQLDAGSTGMVRVVGRWETCGTAVTASTYTATANINITGGANTANANVTLDTDIPASCPTAPPTTTDLVKYSASGSVVTVNGHNTFRITMPDAASAYTVTDVIPAGAVVTQIHERGAETFDFQCGSNATWHHVTLGSLTAHVETNGLPAGCVSWRRPNGEDLFNVVAVRWQMATTPGSSDPELRLHYPETTPFTDAELPGFTPVGIGDTYTNCVQSSDTSMGNAGESCATLNVLPADPRTRMDKDVMAAPDINADTNPVPSSDTDIRDFTLDPDAVPPMTMGDSDILYGVEIGANSSGTDWLNPVVTDLLPDELEYVPYADGGTNFWQVVRYYADGILASDPANQPDCLTPTFTIEENWNGTGRTLLKWEFFNCTFYSSGLNLARLNLYFSTRIKAGTLAGTLIDNYANNGMPDDPLANNNATYTVPEIANMQSSKWVQGKLDSSFSRYPLFGDTDTTGEGVYEFFIENTGNVEVTQFDVVDILPEVGDEDVLAVIGARESEWNLELASDITVERWNSGTSTWDVVPASDMALGPYYSTTTNPCRFVNDPSNNEDLTADESAAAATINTVACDTPNWNSTAPDARSFAFRFSPASSFMPGEQLKVTVNVRLNGVVAANNEIAWNSFAFGGIYLNSLNASTDLLATEPIKVGLRMVDTSNFTSLGNKVWHDVNANGQQDDGEPALAGVTVSLYDDDGGGNPVDADGNATNGTTPRDVTLTDSNGFYRFDGLNPNDDFIIRIDNDNDFSTILHGYGPTTANQGDDTTDSDATTDSDGYPSIAASTGAVTGVDDPADPSEYPTNDFGFVQVASIGNYVWYDLDGQGDQSDGEPPVWGAQVGLYTSTDVQVGITLTTDANGYYLFENVPIGDYYLVFNTGSISGTDPISPALTVAPADWVLTGAGTTGDDTNDSDPDGTGRTSLTSLTAGEVDLTWDAGLVAAPTDPAALTGIVWEDLTPNNTYDIGEPLLSGITMQLLDSNGIPIATQQTDSTGTYYFGNLTPGETYSVVVVPNLGQTLVTADQGGDDAIDSDFNQTTGESTASYTPAANETIIDVDAGIVSPLSLGNMVWSDVNDNGQLDSGEAGIEGILVTLLDDTGSTILMTTTTDANGRYLFTNLSADDYVVRAEVPANMRSSTDIGTTVTPNPTDSDDNGQGIADTGSVQSVAVTLANSGGPTGEADHGVLIDGVLDTTPDVKAYYTVDFGFVPLVKIGDRIWYESDNDGLASTGVITPASSITVNAIDDTGDSYSATTNSSGYYSITVPTNRIYTLTVTTPPGYAPSTVVANAANNENHDASGTVVSVGTVDDLTLDFGFTFSPNVGEACVGNLLTNGSFELGTHTGGTAWAGGSQLTVSTSSGGTSPTGWYRDNSTGGAHYWVDNTNAYSGTKYVYAALNTPIALQDGVQIRPDASVAVQPSTSYQFCAWAADGTANGLESGIAFIVDEDSAPLHYQTHIVPDNGAWDFGATTVIPWAQYCYNFTTDAATTSLDLWVSNADVGGNHSRIVFDEVCLAEITPTVNIGNFVWFDADGNGSVNGDESDYGLTSVTVELLSGGAPISSTTTAGGYYSFEGLAEGDYAVRIPSSNFGVSNPLADYTSSATDGGDPDNDIDNDDNGDGSGTATNIDSQAVTLAVDTEPMTTTIAGDTNYTVDFGFTAPLCADANDLGGTVFSDLNHDGINDTGSGTDATFYNSDIVVYAYDNDNAVVAQTTLRPDGSYLFDDIFTTNTHIRLEFTGLPDYLDVGYSGTGNGTATQKHQVGMCSADLGVLDAADYCQTNPSLATTCFLDNTGDGKALVSWPYNQRGVTPDPSGEALYSQIGTTWGLAYDRTHERIFSAAFLKRHSPLPDADTDNEGDLGAIYAISADTNTANDGTPLWLNLDGATDSGPNVIQVGSIGDNAARGISATPGVPSTDADAFDKVGKVGLGDIDFSGDGSILYAINLYQKTLHGIEINSAGSAGTIHTYTLPDPCNANPGENGGDPYDDTDMRPFALDYHHGDLYVGLVCSGEYSGDPADLRGYVYRFVDSTNTFDSTPVLDFALTYRREHAANHGDCDVDYREWLAWTSTWPASCAINGRIVYPQPMLTDIEFTSDGNLTIGLLDRTGNQGGELNADLTGNMNNGDNTDGFRVNASGDILHATPDYDGTFTIETTWTDDIASTEFYTGDEFIEENGVVNHREIALGALAYLPNSTEIASTGWDAVNKAEGGTFNTGGIFFSYIEDGTRDLIGQSYNVFTNTSNIPGTFGKAAGLGDLELLCERAPIEIGNYIWQDDDGDGIQDPCENGLADIDVTLYSITGTVVATTTTNTSGEYYFDEADGLAPQTTYRVCVPFDDTDLNGATITTQDYASNANHATSGISTDVHDSDGDNGVILAGHSCVQITTGNAGDNDYTIDFGFEPTPPSVAVEKIRNTPDPVLPGAIVTFTIRITNTGTTTITTLPLTDTYSSAYLTFIDIRTIPDADTTADTGQILWGDLTQAAPNGFGMDLGPGNHFDVIVEFVAALDTSALPNTWTINTAQVYTHTVTDTVRIYNPTNVVLTNRDVSVEEGQVVLSWSTVDENDLVGFHVLRLDEASGEPVRLTSDEQIILAQGAANGADYRFEDAAGNVDAEHHYVLEMVMADGTRPIVDMGTVNQGPSVWTVYLPVLRK